jgi:hypothetical protein
MKDAGGWTNITFTVCALFMNTVHRKALKGKASSGKGKVVLCVIKHHATKMYGLIIAAHILITLALHEGQWACS